MLISTEQITKLKEHYAKIAAGLRVASKTEVAEAYEAVASTLEDLSREGPHHWTGAPTVLLEDT
jgi:hypothetical protein